MTTNSLSEQISNRTPQLNNRAENQTVKKKPTNFSAVSSVDPNDEMIMLIMRCLILLSYIWQEICPMFVFGTMIRGILNAVINNINSYTKSACLLSLCLNFKKNPYSIKKLKYKINSCVFVRSPLFEMVFIRNGLCMKLYVKIKVPPRTKNPCSK